MTSSLSTSSTLSSLEQQSKPLLDSDIHAVNSWMLSEAVRSLLYGVYVTLSIIAAYLFLKQGVSLRPSRRGSDLSPTAKARLALFILTIIMLLFATVSLVLEIQAYLIQLPLSSFEPPQDLDKFIKSMTDQQILLTFVDRINYPISDGIVVWRAWIMFPNSLFVKIALTFLFLSSCVGVFVDASLGTVGFLRDISFTGPNTRGLIMAIPMIVTNAVATGLIAWKTWHHYNTLKKNLSDSSPLTRVQKVLFLLVESGVVYCIFWVAWTSITVTGGTGTTSFQTYSAAMPFISALYPITIIILVATVEDDNRYRTRMSLSQSIRFCSMQSTTLSSAVEVGDDIAK
ncbi:hypothetical protein K435DRAFT_973015 [Dendrothele bispora CBS 962.96]|uniref:Uncharacterized protein n=1 Tax=Dendrothele bispora (strain CBS 962.96) TaxID=1314807 RepID=A0A4S8KV96_DENBC|nr:hypothetical protein K435DRAFT_973015 [Dendrothele bispora CBS 962.96]